MKKHNTTATTATTAQNAVHLSAQHAIDKQQAQSDTLQRLQAVAIAGRICSKTGAMDSVAIAQDELQLLAVIADGTSFEQASYALTASLANCVSPAWINTGPDQLNMLRIADPYGFAVYCLQFIFCNDKGNATATACAKYRRNVQLAKLRDRVENKLHNESLLLAFNKHLSSIVSCAKPRTLRDTIAKLTDITSLNLCITQFAQLVTYVAAIEQELIAQLTKSGMTPTLLRQNRERHGGSSAMAASYSRNSSQVKQKWLRYLAEYDKSFASQIYTSLVNAVTADDLQVPRDDQNFGDVTISDAKLVSIKASIAAQQERNEFDEILGDIDLSGLA